MTTLVLTGIVCPRCLAAGYAQRTERSLATYQWKCPVHGAVLDAVDLHHILSKTTEV